MNETPETGIKEAVQSVVKSLPDDVSWDQIHYHLYVRQQIEAGLADSDAGRTISNEEMRRRLSEHIRNKKP